MKPHIVKRWGMWYCGIRGVMYAVGYTPAMAYAEWEALCKQ